MRYVLVLLFIAGCAEVKREDVSLARRQPNHHSEPHGYKWDGGFVTGPTDTKAVTLVFTGGAYGEGAEVVLNTLRDKGVKAGFFLTGNFLRRSDLRNSIERMVNEGHYVGAHSDKHPDYVKNGKTAISHRKFRTDLDRNFDELAKFGVQPEQAKFFIPPSEEYNQQIVRWSQAYGPGLYLFSFTSGKGKTNSDYKDPSYSTYLSSQEILDTVWAAHTSKGLSGSIILVHVGVGPKRKDKLFNRLDDLIDGLRNRGYQIKRIDDFFFKR